MYFIYLILWSTKKAPTKVVAWERVAQDPH